MNKVFFAIFFFFKLVQILINKKDMIKSLIELLCEQQIFSLLVSNLERYVIHKFSKG